MSVYGVVRSGNGSNAGVLKASIRSGYFLPHEFLNSDIYEGYSPRCKQLVAFLFDKMISNGIDFIVEKRKRNDFVLVASSRAHATTNKNVLTVWTYRSSIDIRIMPDPPEHYYSEADMDDRFIQCVKMKYNNIK